jgi:predicted nucleotide-binding protein
MAKAPTSQPQSLPSLLVTHDEARQKIQDQINKGQAIANEGIQSEEDISKAREKLKKWSDYNLALLKCWFSNETTALEYGKSRHLKIGGYESFSDKLNVFRDDVRTLVSRLESLLEQLVLYSEPQNQAVGTLPAKRNITSGRDVFIVHGHDEAATQSVARFIEKLDLHPIILHEQPNAGRTIIEKVEDYSDVDYAVILLTPDDIGGLKDKPTELLPRARQNVILEMGYFIGKLGRERVCALHKKSVEIPTDFLGVLYIPMDSRGAWQLKLAQEIAKVGIEVDLNRLHKRVSRI